MSSRADAPPRAGLPLVLLAMLGAGCVQHRAVLEPPQDGPPPHLVAGPQALASFDEPLVAEGPLPRALSGSAWRRSEDGTLLRAEVQVETPRPWWQRFPADIVSDLIPHDFTVEERTRIRLAPVPAAEPETLTAEARRYGYAGRAQEEAP